jgi:hypothetical protein
VYPKDRKQRLNPAQGWLRSHQSQHQLLSPHRSNPLLLQQDADPDVQLRDITQQPTMAISNVE